MEDWYVLRSVGNGTELARLMSGECLVSIVMRQREGKNTDKGASTNRLLNIYVLKARVGHAA